MSDDPQTEGYDPIAPSIGLFDVQQVLRQELMAQNQELILAFSNELDCMVKLITSSIIPPLNHLMKGIDRKADEESAPMGANSECAPVRKDRRSPNAQSDLTRSTSSPDEETGMHEGDSVVSNHVAFPSSEEDSEIPPGLMKAKAGSRDPSVIQNALLEAQLDELIKRSLSTSSDDLSIKMRISMCLHSKVAEKLLAVLIIMNAAMFGVHADYRISNPYGDPPRYFAIIEWFFTIVFSLELILRLVIDRLEFFSYRHPLFTWNCLDFFLVVQAYIEVILVSINVNLSFARLLRMLRMVRMLKLLRFLTDMRLMVMSILGSCMPLLWAMVLLGLIVYVFAIVLLQLVEEKLADLQGNVPYFASLYRLTFSLFMCISGGVSWIELVDPISYINPLIIPLFVGYISFSVFCVLNIVTGLFCERASRMSEEDEENMMIEEYQNRKKWTKDVEAVFMQIDKTGDGEITVEEFCIALSDLRLQTALRARGVDLRSASLLHVFEMFDFDQSGKIDVSEFAMGLQHLHGDAKAIDIARVKHELRSLHEKLNKLDKHLGDLKTLNSRHTKKSNSNLSVMHSLRNEEEGIPGTNGDVSVSEKTQTNIRTTGFYLSSLPAQPLPALPTLEPTPTNEGKMDLASHVMPVSASRAFRSNGSNI